MAVFQYLQEEQPGVMTGQIYQIFRPSDSCPDVAGPLWRRSRPLFNRWGRSSHDLTDALMVLDELLALAGVEGGRGWEEMGSGSSLTDASTARSSLDNCATVVKLR